MDCLLRELRHLQRRSCAMSNPDIKTVLTEQQIEQALDGVEWQDIVQPGQGNRKAFMIRSARAIEAAVLSALAEKDADAVQEWQDMTGYGQVKVGDFISFFIGDHHFGEKVKIVLNAGTDREELIYNKKKNYYVICKNVLTGFGNVKKFRYFANCAALQSAGDGDKTA